jgi:hypothetical protein
MAGNPKMFRGVPNPGFRKFWREASVGIPKNFGRCVYAREGDSKTRGLLARPLPSDDSWVGGHQGAPAEKVSGPLLGVRPAISQFERGHIRFPQLPLPIACLS